MNKPKLNEPDVEQTTTTPIIETQCTSCSKYPLKNYKINFKEQEEQKIFKELNNKGWKVVISNDEWFVVTKPHPIMRNSVTRITINNTTRQYVVNLYNKDNQQTLHIQITIEIHQLLHRLFELWGWFDE